MIFVLHVRYASGHVQTLTFSSLIDRTLYLIALSAQPVTLRCEDV